jgi:hypothetical protein
MAMFETFKRRKEKAAKGSKSEVYVYDGLPDKLRVQITQIIASAIGGWEGYVQNYETWVGIHKFLCRSEGRDYLLKAGLNPALDILNFIRQSDADDALSAIEMCCRSIDFVCRAIPEYMYADKGIQQGPDDAIDEINYWFREAGVGYQYASEQIIRVDSQFTHAEIVQPALTLLSDHRFSGAQKEYLKAHAYYRSGDYKDTVVWAGKAFESAMKVVCDLRRWDYPSGARASDLLKILKAKRLFPDYLDTSFDQLLGTLSSGLPKVRNEEGAHGDGGIPRQTPGYVAAYALHLAASKILFIAEANAAKR